jgi:hypothetical protein
MWNWKPYVGLILLIETLCAHDWGSSSTAGPLAIPVGRPMGDYKILHGWVLSEKAAIEKYINMGPVPRVSSETCFAFCFAKLDAKRVSLFRETNWPFRKISCFPKQPVSHVLLFLIRNETAHFACFAIFFTKFLYFSQKSSFIPSMSCYFWALTPIKNFYAAPDPAAPDPTLLYSWAKFWTKN